MIKYYLIQYHDDINRIKIIAKFNNLNTMRELREIYRATEEYHGQKLMILEVVE